MRILLLSDIHANLTALEGVIKDAGEFERVWCLGDIVGYGPEPNDCIDRLRGFELVCLAGNHDLAVTGKTSLWDFTETAQEAIFWTRHRLTSENPIGWAACPRLLSRSGMASRWCTPARVTRSGNIS